MINKALIVLFFIIVGCGTDTGNPGQEPTHANTGMDGITTDPESITHETVIPTLVKSICTKMNTCEGENISRCEGHIFALENIDTEIGLEEGEYSNLGEVDQAFKNQELGMDSINSKRCIQNINAFTCDSSQVSSIANDLENVAEQLPDACEKIVAQDK